MLGKRLTRAIRFLLFSLAFLSILTGCSIPWLENYLPSLATATEPAATSTQAEITFRAQVPAGTSPASVFIDILDEVTGLSLNPVRFKLDVVDATHYALQIPITSGSTIKYRYVLDGTPPQGERTPLGDLVRYRLYLVNGSGQVEDIVSSWAADTFEGETGRIQGTITDTSDLPLPNILVTAGGLSTLTAADGSFVLDGLTLGLHNVVAASLDGSYHPYQQGALVAAGATTPAPIALEPAQWVSVTFNVTLPEDTDPNAVVRLIGDTYTLGNTFADLSGGVNTLASRAPVISKNAEGHYSLTLDLPSGLDLRYKYTLGDGFWNAERLSNGHFRLRQLIVPAKNTVINDVVETWSTADYAPVHFEVTVPENTPTEDVVSIQFNPYTWTEPIPMWPAGENYWQYVLYSPLNILEKVGYRYCRNDQCGLADDSTTMGSVTAGKTLTINPEGQSLQDTVDAWAWWSSETSPIAVAGTEITPRSSGFVAGVELSANYNPSWQPYLETGLKDLQNLKENWVILSPTWSYSSTKTPALAPLPGQDPLWPDLSQIVERVQQDNQSIALYPQLNFPMAYADWWLASTRDAGWWQTWFDRYRTYLLHFADFASRNSINALIIGGPELQPALPGGKLFDGSSSGVPDDAEMRWRQLIAEVRTHYTGTLLWALPYSGTFDNAPAFISAFDQIYLLWSAPLTDVNESLETDLADEFGRQLDEVVFPAIEPFQKTVVIGLAYPSADGAATSCVRVDGTCQNLERLRANDPSLGVAVDLNEQADIYDAALTAINPRTWVAGLVSRGYFPAATLQDFSPSVHGKPAGDVLWYWFPRLLGQED